MRIVEVMRTKQGLQIPLKHSKSIASSMPGRIEDFVTTNTVSAFNILGIRQVHWKLSPVYGKRTVIIWRLKRFCQPGVL